MEIMTAPVGTLTHMPGLARPPERLDDLALFLDMDGVLAPLAPRPEDVVPVARRPEVLRRLAERLEGRLAIVSGRTLAEIDRISEAAASAASGVHGLERRRHDGSLERSAPHPAVRGAHAAFAAYAADRPGMIVEDKAVSVGLHYRQAPGFAADARALGETIARETGLTIQHGDHVLELKTPGTSKGTAVRAFMAEAPFAGALPVMVGDDLTDEDGFEAAAALGGFGVLVGPERQTAARYRLDDVEAVLGWLEGLAG